VITAPFFAHIAAAVVLATPAPASSAPESSALSSAELYTQIQQAAGHYHEGELGEKFLLIESNIKCDCGCSLDVHSCQFQMQCGTSPAWSERIRSELEAGRSVEVIEAGFVADFGPTVLMRPPAEGFNLVGYLLPAMAIVTAGMVMGLIVRGGARGMTAEAVPARELSGDEEDKLRDAMKKMDEAESPDW
jgi:cytochrome c-type biogenesis protein CcmH/NrfF